MSTAEKQNVLGQLYAVQNDIKRLEKEKLRLVAQLNDGKIPLDVNNMRKGMSILYEFPNNGYDGDKKHAEKHLILNKRYTVIDYQVGGSSSEVQVYTEKGGYQWFNSVMFGEYHKDLESK